MSNNFNFSVIVKIFLFLSILFIYCGRHKEDKIPITTSSTEALSEYFRGRDLAERLRGQEALQHFEKAIELDPDFALAHLNLGFVLPTTKEFFVELGKAVILADKVSAPERLQILGVQAGVNGLPMKQREYWSKLVADYPEDERAQNLMGNYYFEQHEYNIAIGYYRRAIEINRKFSQSYNQLGYCHRYLGNYEEAKNAFKRYIDLIPDDPNPYDSYAELLMKMGQFEESIKIYQKALKFDPHFVPSHIGIASNLNFLGKHQEARAQLQKLRAIARNDRERHDAGFATAISYIDEGKTNKAIEEMKSLFEMGEKNNDTANMARDLGIIGNIYFEEEKYTLALQKYNEAVTMIQNSDFPEEIKKNSRRFQIYNSAKIALMKGDLLTAEKGAEEYQQKAMAIQNRYQIWLSHELNGLIAMQKKDYDEAIGEFNRANKQNPYILYRIALAYLAKGDKSQAKKMLTKAANHNTLNDMNYAFIRLKAKKMLQEKFGD